MQAFTNLVANALSLHPQAHALTVCLVRQQTTLRIAMWPAYWAHYLAC